MAQLNKPGSVAQTLAKNRVGMLDISGFIIGSAAPLTVIAGVITTAYAVTGIVGIPLAVLMVGSALALFSVGFNAMSRLITNAGAFSAYIAQGLGKPPGVGAAFIATIAYNSLQVGTYGAIGFFASKLVETKVGSVQPWWLYGLAAWLLVAVFGLLRVEFSAKLLLILLGLEVAVALLFNAANLAHPAGGVIRFDAFDPTRLLVEGFGAAIIIASTVFVGWEQGPIFSEEAVDAKRTVPGATYICLAVITVLVTTSAWGIVVAVGPDQVAEVTGRDQIDTIFVLARGFFGGFVVDVASGLFITSLLAAALSFATASNRYMFSMGRERVLPKILASLNRHQAPHVASLIQSAIGLAAIVVCAATDSDPVMMFFLGGTVGAYGVMILMAVTSIAVVRFFWDNRDVSPWVGRWAPLASAIVLALLLGTATANFKVLLPLAPGEESPLTWIFPTAFVVSAVAGVLRALWMRSYDRGSYDGIGLGAMAAAARAQANRPRPTALGRS